MQIKTAQVDEKIDDLNRYINKAKTILTNEAGQKELKKFGILRNKDGTSVPY